MDEKTKDYFMAFAELAATRSEDPHRKVGACLVDSNTYKILGIGYNCFPEKCESFSWSKKEYNFEENKHFYVVHAERNAIYNANSADLKGAILFVTLHPCSQCAQTILKYGISKIFYLDAKHDKAETPFKYDTFKAAKKMFDQVKIVCEQYEPKISKVQYVPIVNICSGNDDETVANTSETVVEPPVKRNKTK